jgi:hypothetical protein
MAVLAGVALGLTAWVDYYLFAYGVVAIVTLCVMDLVEIRTTIQRPSHPIARRTALACCAILAVIAIAVGLTGGWVIALGAFQVSMHSPANLMAAVSVGLVFLFASTWRVHIVRRRADTRPVLLRLGTMAVVGGLLIAPLAWNAVALYRSGDYVRPPRYWRSAPAGVDLATVVIGPPLHPLSRDGVQNTYRRLGIDLMEMSGWLGVTGPVLAFLGWRAYRHEASECMFGVLAAIFFIWALGPFFHIAGINTWRLLPQQLLRFIPLLENVRIPSRAMILVAFCVSMLASKWASGRPRALVWCLTGCVFLEQLALPFPTVSAAIPEAYYALATRDRGVVLDVPFGFGDGLEVSGSFDIASLLYQTVHGQPMLAGAVARLPDRIRDLYNGVPAITAIVSESEGKIVAFPACGVALADLQGMGVRYIVVHEQKINSDLRSFLSSLPRHIIATGADTTVFEVENNCIGQNQGG